MAAKTKNHYILVGDRKTWNISLREHVWGFSEKTKGFWTNCQIGDLVAFYVTSPMKKIIGFGIIDQKFENDDLLWTDEKLQKSAIWKYRINLKILHVQNNWRKGISPPKEIILNQGRKKFLLLCFIL
ncbi:hypothetical protein SCCGRSA3_02550 [Marine Group I thaumarchaeote SCGC RSA3]|uniref:EVE domain protein n=2 Tax=Marine Group I TaxID=905826 RepID=A0A081RNL5_9ARCH|nr:hypothetical protein AAA799N04_00703 [Marine Group I thaumarchaeote SCGC AAA799-N04]KFM15802.1 hypothetical protein SCCGRSA3_02550 [Marine Group I thaumarchaeote SCGC RSA3]